MDFDAVMENDHTADKEFQDLIDAFTDGWVAEADLANFGPPDEVLNAMKKALDFKEPE